METGTSKNIIETEKSIEHILILVDRPILKNILYILARVGH